MRKTTIAKTVECDELITEDPFLIYDKIIPTKFIKDLETLINTHCIENGSNTPDYMLAEYIVNTIKVYNDTIAKREKWYGRGPKPIETSGSLNGQCMSIPHAISAIKDLIKIQCSNGNWNYDEYMHGLANGLILSLSILDGADPEFMEAPEDGWLKDKPKSSKVEPILASILSSLVLAKDDTEDKLAEINTMGKAYNIFKKIGISGFKTPKLCSRKGKQIVKTCTVQTKGEPFYIRLASKGDDIQYQLFKHGSENYRYDKVTRITTDIRKFLKDMSEVRSLKEYKSKIEQVLTESL